MKKQSTKKRPNLMQFTLSEQSLKILENFSTKYGTSKSFVIDRALMILAGQYHRKVVISYELLTEPKSTTTTTSTNQDISIKEFRRQHPLNTEDDISDDEITDMIERIEKSKLRTSHFQ